MYTTIKERGKGKGERHSTTSPQGDGDLLLFKLASGEIASEQRNNEGHNHDTSEQVIREAEAERHLSEQSRLQSQCYSDTRALKSQRR